ncbi:MAG: ATP-binding protein [Bacillota bacterium]
MKIAVLSGKGGTGKTLVSVNLAAVAEKANYLDCDVEEPNGHLFFKPVNVDTKEVTVKIPVVDQEKCTGCKICVDFCRFNALAYTTELVVFEDICHSCGGCTLLCPEQAFTEKDRVIGKIEKGHSENVAIFSGILKIGVPTGVPIIAELLQEQTTADEITVIDCPPGSACIVMESIKDADYCVLVAEPTLFGVHNLEMVYDLVKLFNKPHGVLLNKCFGGKNPSEEFCSEKDIKILGRIPFDFELGKLNADAKIVARESDRYHRLFVEILAEIVKEVRHEATFDS